MPFDVSSQGLPQDPVLEVLTAAGALLARGWCRSALARDGRGRSVPYSSDAAQSFCLAGAVHRAGLAQPRGTMGALLVLMRLAEPLTVADCNDRLFAHPEEARAFLARAIELRRAELAGTRLPRAAAA